MGLKSAYFSNYSERLRSTQCAAGFTVLAAESLRKEFRCQSELLILPSNEGEFALISGG